jgi:thioredoxin reductase
VLPERAQVLIVGGGPAGLAAAIELKRLGVNEVVVAEREKEAGGIPRLCHHTGFGLRDQGWLLSGPGYAERYRQQARAAGVAIHTSTTITSWAPSAEQRSPVTLGYTSPHGLGQIEAEAVLLATGCRERPRSARLVPGSRPAGVFTTGSLQRFVYEGHLPVGGRAVIVGAELVSLSALMTLRHAKVPAAMLLTELPRHQLYLPYLPMKWLLADWLGHVPIVTGAKLTNIIGRERVEAVEITHLGPGRTETVACDTVIFTGDWVPEHETARLGGLAMDAGTRGPQLDTGYHTSRHGVFAAGNLLRGAEIADQAALEGRDAAWYIFDFLHGDQWPEPRISVVAEPPLEWICPNVIAPMPAAPFRFRSREFAEHARLQVKQDSRVLHSQMFRRLIVNESMRLAGDWARTAQPGGGPIRLIVVQ